MADIIGTIIDAAAKLFGLRGELSKARKERKQEVADFLAAIGKNIEEVSASLKQGQYPHGGCQVLLTHSQMMEQAIGDLVGEVRAREIANQLREVWEIERLHAEMGAMSPPEKQRSLDALDQGAGLFSATADIVRVSP